MTYPIFQEGEIIAYWRNNQEIFQSVIRNIADDGNEILVKHCALAKLTDLQKQDYIMAKLENRTGMKIQEK